MAKTKSNLTSRPNAPGSSGKARRPDPAPATVSSPEVRLRFVGWRLWAIRMVLAVAGPVLLLGLAEAALRVIGFGYPTAFCLRRGDVYVDNEKYLCQFYSRKTQRTNLRPTPFAVAAEKPADAVRIVVLGESAAAGAPEPAYSFGRVLERMLRHEYPGRSIQVINAAMRGVNSHILLPVARDCRRLHPDLFVIYMGNNEVVGLHAPGPHSGRFTPYLGLLRAVQWARSTRVGELLEPALQGFNREGTATEQQDDAFFQSHRVAADDRGRAAVYDNFRANLADICQVARRAGAKVVLATVANNLKDCPPLGSLHRPALSDSDKAAWQNAYQLGTQQEAAGNKAAALTHYRAAAAVDDHFAELHFRMGRCTYQLGEFDKARDEFRLARDWDALQFRTDSRQNEIIRRQGREAPQAELHLVDVERAFEQSDGSDQGIPGERFFYDHVHLTFDGAYLAARTLLPAVRTALGPRLGPAPAAPVDLTREECAEQLAFTRINELQINSTAARLLAQPPFTSQLEHRERQAALEKAIATRFGDLNQEYFDHALATFRTAIKQARDDWQLPYLFARSLLVPNSRFPEAIVQLETAQRLLPYCVPIRLELSRTLRAAGKRDEALAQLNTALALDPKSEEAHAGLAALQDSGRNPASP